MKGCAINSLTKLSSWELVSGGEKVLQLFLIFKKNEIKPIIILNLQIQIKKFLISVEFQTFFIYLPGMV